MLRPIERPPYSKAPRFAASMIPGPPPVMVAWPFSARSWPSSRAFL